MPAYLDQLGSVPLAVVAVALLFTAAWSVGRWFIPIDGLSRRRHWESQLLRVVIGLNLIGFVGIGLGMTGALADGRSVWLLIAAGLTFWWQKRLRHSPTLQASHRWRWPTFGETLFVLMAFITLGPALCYPTGWDEMVYHGVLPRRWLADGVPAVYRDLPYSGFPSFGEVLFWLIAPVEALIAPRLVIWLSWMIGLLLLECLLRRFGARRASFLLTTGFAISPAVLMISANCYVESLLMMNVVAILLAAIRDRHRDSAIILGVLAGGAAATKLTGVAVMGLPVLWYCGMAFMRRKHDSRTTGAELSALFKTAYVTLVIALPFYLRPWFATGNPCYPYLAVWFTTAPETRAMSQHHHTIGDLSFGVRSVETLLTAPILMGFQDQLYDGGLGWQWLLLLLLAAWGMLRTRRHPGSGARIIWPMSVFVALYLAWFLTAQQGRFAVPMASAMVCVAAAGLRALSATMQRAVVAVFLVASIVSFPWKTAGYYAASWETLAGLWSQAGGLDDATQGRYVPLLAAIEEHTPPESRVLLLFEHRLLYMPRKSVIGTPYFQEQWLMPPTNYAAAQPLMKQLRDGNITHIAIAKGPVGPDWSPDSWEKSQPVLQGIGAALESGELQLVWQSDQHLLIAVTATSPAPR